MNESDPRVNKILHGKCWAKGCERMSEFKTGFLRLDEKLEKPCLCTVHQSYNFQDTHYGEYDVDAKKWSCCSKRDRESYCEDMKTALKKFEGRIPVTNEQQKSYDDRQRALNARVEDDFTSCNWDRS